MGCPKEFSIKGGMGAALLTQPDKVKSILTTLVSNLTIPVTCKIRILPKLKDTLDLVKIIEATGVKAIGVHGRWKEERSSQPCHPEYIRAISETVSIPVIANGCSLSVKEHAHVATFQRDTGCSSVMLARAAQWNPSVFRKEGLLPKVDVIKQYIKLALEFEAGFTNVKYVLCKMFGDTAGTELGRRLGASVNLQDICEAFDVEDYRQEILKNRKLKRKCIEDEPDEKRQKIAKDNKITLNVTYNRKFYPRTVSPLQKVYDFCQRESLPQPRFNTTMNEDKLFISEMTVNGIVYTTKLWDKRKKAAEQGAAIAFLHHNGMHDGRIKDDAL